MQIDLERKAYGELLAWKKDPSHSTLEITGASRLEKRTL